MHVYPHKCPELLPNINKPPKDFFSKAKKMVPFHEDVFMGKLLKWIIRTDQSFSVVDNKDFQHLLIYLKKDVTLKARRTIMRRLEELCVAGDKSEFLETSFSLALGVKRQVKLQVIGQQATLNVNSILFVLANLSAFLAMWDGHIVGYLILGTAHQM